MNSKPDVIYSATSFALPYTSFESLHSFTGDNMVTNTIFKDEIYTSHNMRTASGYIGDCSARLTRASHRFRCRRAGLAEIITIAEQIRMKKSRFGRKKE